ncbi:hypothetical protein [Deinococcus carri]
MPARSFLHKAALPLLTLLTLSSAQGAQWRFGVQASTLLPDNFGLAATVGGHLSVQGAVSRSLDLRGLLEGNVGLNRAPEVRLDLTLLKNSGSLYYGGGIGSGLLADFGDPGSGIPLIVYSPLLLANVHGVLGYDFGGPRLEGMARLGPNPGVGLRASFPLR